MNEVAHLDPLPTNCCHLVDLAYLIYMATRQINHSMPI